MDQPEKGIHGRVTMLERTIHKLFKVIGVTTEGKFEYWFYFWR